MVLIKGKLIVVFVGVLGFLAPQTNAITCSAPSLKPPLKAVGSQTSFGVGDILRFHCDKSDTGKPYYKLKGAIKIECQKDGTWSSKIPSCVVFACSDVGPSVPNARLLTIIIRDRTNNFGNRIKYQCSLGFTLVSRTPFKICQKNGYWEGNVTCADVVCPQPSISNGDVSYSSLGFGGTANYTCDKGYAMKWQSTRSCDKSGHWSGVAPQCLRLCPQLSSPNNGHIKTSMDYPLSHVVGTTVQFKCNQNYRMRGDESRRCQYDGRWSGQQPKCVINTCGSPGPFANGVMTTTLPNYVIGTVVKFSCYTGYKLVGDVSMRTCMRDGYWTGVKNPTCEVLFCEEPGRILHGSHNNIQPKNKYPFGQSVSYSCTSQYYLWGNTTVTCQADHGLTYWSGPVPSCLTLSGFDEECVRQNGKFKVELGRPICLFPVTKTTPFRGGRKTDKELDTLTIVTASAGSTLGALVILLSVMLFVRRFHRNRRFRNHSIRSRFYSDDDHVTLIATYRGDLHFALPSYDEAMSQVQRDPPPFESVVQSNGVVPTNNNSPVLPITDGTSSSPQGGPTRNNSTAHALNENSADQHINFVCNPMNDNSSAGTSLLSHIANPEERHASERPQENRGVNSVSSAESLLESEPSSSREGLNLSVSEDDEQSLNESHPLMASNT